MILVLLLIVGLISLCRWWYKPKVPPMEPLGPLPTAADPKLLAKQPRDGSKKAAVIGGGGNIGYLVAEQLCLPSSGFDEILILDVRPPPQGLPDAPKAKVSFQKCDITNKDSMIDALNGVTHVVHTAALIDIRNDPLCQFKSYQVNVRGTWNALNAAILNGVRAFVFTSSSSLGQSNHRSMIEDEEDGIRRMEFLPFPSEAYRSSKIASLRLVLQTDGRAGLRTASVAFTVNYSPYDTFATQAIRSGNFAVMHDSYGDSSFAAGISIAECHYLALKKLEETPDKVGGQLFFVSDFNMDMLKFFSAAQAALMGKSEIKRLNPLLVFVINNSVGFFNWLTHSTFSHPLLIWLSPEADMQSRRTAYQGPPRKAQELLGFKPRTLEEGLKWVVEGCKKYDQKMKK